MQGVHGKVLERVHGEETESVNSIEEVPQELFIKAVLRIQNILNWIRIRILVYKFLKSFSYLIFPYR